VVEVNQEQAVKKIKKCLALSESSNPHEAAIALQQAHKLMLKYGISDQNIADSEVAISHYQSRFSRPPQWLQMLVSVVATAFGTSAFGDRGKVWFVGSDVGVELSTYTAEVLVRAAELDRARYLKNDYLKMRERGATESKRIAGGSFLFGWVCAVGKTVREFASPLSDEIRHQHKRAIENALDAATKASRKPSVRADHHHASAGVAAGSKVKLHNGIRQAKSVVPALGFTEV
jgi:hypothetical protein